MRRALVLALAAGNSLALTHEQPPVRFTTQAALVTIDVLVTEGQRPVTGLTGADFDVIDNGVPQRVQQLYVERLPLNVTLVLDASGSVHGQRLEGLKMAAATVVDRLRPGDRAAVLQFSHALDLRSALTGDRARLHEGIRGLEAGGSTALRDATYAAIALRGAAPARTLVLICTDGVDTASILEERRVVQAARRSDVTIYAVGVRAPRPPPLALNAPHPVPPPGSEFASDDRFLKTIVEETGGRLLHTDDHRTLGSTFARVLDEFNSRYVLGYAPAGVPDSGWHRVEVRLKTRRARVLSRRGYFAN